MKKICITCGHTYHKRKRREKYSPNHCAQCIRTEKRKLAQWNQDAKESNKK